MNCIDNLGGVAPRDITGEVTFNTSLISVSEFKAIQYGKLVTITGRISPLFQGVNQAIMSGLPDANSQSGYWTSYIFDATHYGSLYIRTTTLIANVHGDTAQEIYLNLSYYTN